MAKEYIEREAAITAAILAHNLIDNNPCRNIRYCIGSIPAADVVPVVRCGECENWQSNWKPSGAKDGTHFCAMVGLSTSADWFCADGERRDGDEG